MLCSLFSFKTVTKAENFANDQPLAVNQVKNTMIIIPIVIGC
ncbi:hypothetical protein LACWKB8_1354 [Lactobacillus sp. wkB8]|nr:hypothetical protein LACWKB8_1354 [Lactobacillus sp. wkB8]